MAKTINKVILIGHLGNDPELKYHTNGAAYCNFSLATNSSYKDDKGNPVEKTEWHRIVAWKNLAEIVHKYLKKGSFIYCEGSLKYSEYEKNGTKMYSTSIVMNQMSMLDKRTDSTPEKNGNTDADDSRQAPPPAEDLPF